MVAVETAIRNLWSLDAELSARIPIDRLTVGRPSQVRLPCAVLDIESIRPLVHACSGEPFERIDASIACWDVEYAALRSTVEGVRRVLDGAGGTDGDASRAFVIRVGEQSIARHAEGHWAAVVKIRVSISPAP